MSWKSILKIFGRIEKCSIEDTCLKVLTFCNKQLHKEGVCTHSVVIKLGLQGNLYVSNNLLSLYGKCFGLDHARRFFNEMPYKDVVSWTGMLSAFVKHEEHEEALELFDSMRISGQHPNEFTLTSILRTCSALGEFERGMRIQAGIIKHGFMLNPVLCSSLVDFYSKWDRTEEAYKVFSRLSHGDTVCWTTMISSYVQSQDWNKALQLYFDMVESGVFPNEYTFVKVLTACSHLSVDCGRLVHTQLIRRRVELNLVLKTALVDMYMKHQRIEDALKVSKQTCEQDVLLWTTLISGFTQNLKPEDAIGLYSEMVMSGVVPSNYTYAAILNACSSIEALKLGQQIHSRVIMAGFENDVSVGNALLDMYMKCSNMTEIAFKVFDMISLPNVISWTSLIAGLTKCGLEEESFRLFEKMRSLGEKPNSFTLSSILKASGAIKSPSQTRMVHGYIIKTKANDDIVVANALLDAYGESGMINDAFRVIRLMNYKDVITYTSLATRVNQMGFHQLALNIINYMRDDNIMIDCFSLATFLSASAALGRMELGNQLHCYSVKSGLGEWISVSNGLVDLYGKCGCIDDATKAFGEIFEPDVVSWNSLISALASQGHISSALSTFEDMRLAGVKPNSITLWIVLSACSQGGLVDLGLEYFNSMTEKHAIVPQMEHYVCLIDSLGQSGQLEKAMGVIDAMPFRPDALIYKSLLGACKSHENISLGEDIARRALEHYPNDPAIYGLLSNMKYGSSCSDLCDRTHSSMRESQLRNISERLSFYPTNVGGNCQAMIQ